MSLRRILLGVLVGIALSIVLEPIVEGYHLGYNSATDTECLTRLGIQWCKGGPPISSPTPTSAPPAPSAATTAPAVPPGDKVDRTGFVCFRRYYNARRDLCMVP